MRDGIYKGLKLARPWKTLLRRCERQADRGARTSTAAAAALDRELRHGLSPGLLRQLRVIADSRASLLPGFEPPLEIDLPSATPFDDAVRRHFQRVTSDGVRRHEAVREALSGAVQEWRGRCLRQVREHYISEAGTAAREVLSAAESALNGVNCVELADGLIRAEPPRDARTPPLSPDEDLRRQ
jgi:hypothetical protein